MPHLMRQNQWQLLLRRLFQATRAAQQHQQQYQCWSAISVACSVRQWMMICFLVPIDVWWSARAEWNGVVSKSIGMLLPPAVLRTMPIVFWMRAEPTFSESNNLSAWNWWMFFGMLSLHYRAHKINGECERGRGRSVKWIIAIKPWIISSDW